MYSPEVLDHFEHPRNVGDLDGAHATAQVDNPACGDVLRLSLKLRDDVIEEARFRAKGCVPSIACGSKLTEMITGRAVTDASRLTRRDLAAAIGGLPAGSDHAAQLALDALTAALKQAK